MVPSNAPAVTNAEGQPCTAALRGLQRLEQRYGVGQLPVRVSNDSNATVVW